MKSRVNSGSVLTVGVAARRMGVAPHVLRHWESMGLLTPARQAGQRRYNADDLRQIATILRVKEAGLGLNDIANLLTSRNIEVRRETLRGQRAMLEERIVATRAALDLVNAALECEHEDFTQCPHYRAAVERYLPT